MQNTRNTTHSTTARTHVGVGAAVHARKSLALIRTTPMVARPWGSLVPVAR